MKRHVFVVFLFFLSIGLSAQPANNTGLPSDEEMLREYSNKSEDEDIILGSQMLYIGYGLGTGRGTVAWGQQTDNEYYINSLKERAFGNNPYHSVYFPTSGGDSQLNGMTGSALIIQYRSMDQHRVGLISHAVRGSSVDGASPLSSRSFFITDLRSDNAHYGFGGETLYQYSNSYTNLGYSYYHPFNKKIKLGMGISLESIRIVENGVRSAVLFNDSTNHYETGLNKYTVYDYGGYVPLVGIEIDLLKYVTLAYRFEYLDLKGALSRYEMYLVSTSDASDVFSPFISYNNAKFYLTLAQGNTSMYGYRHQVELNYVTSKLLTISFTYERQEILRSNDNIGLLKFDFNDKNPMTISYDWGTSVGEYKSTTESLIAKAILHFDL